MPIIPLSAGDKLRLKKPHPCGGDLFSVIRVGSQVRIVCNTCGHDMTLDRIKLERSVKHVIPKEEKHENEKGSSQT